MIPRVNIVNNQVSKSLTANVCCLALQLSSVFLNQKILYPTNKNFEQKEVFLNNVYHSSDAQN